MTIVFKRKNLVSDSEYPIWAYDAVKCKGIEFWDEMEQGNFVERNEVIQGIQCPRVYAMRITNRDKKWELRIMLVGEQRLNVHRTFNTLRDAKEHVNDVWQMRTEYKIEEKK